MKKQLAKLFFLVALILPVHATAVELSLLVLYNSDFAKAKNPRVTIQNYINEANRAYSLSKMNLKLKLAHSQQYSLPASVGEGPLAMMSSHTKTLGSRTPLWDLQDRIRPDITIYIGNITSRLCGKARFPHYTGQSLARLKRNNPRVSHVELEKRYYDSHSSELHAVATSAWQAGCGAQTFIHEIGHVLGAGHGEVREDWEALGGLLSGTNKWHPGKPIEEAVGHGYHNIYRTIMTYPDVYGTAHRVNRISNPSVHFNSLATGTNSRNAADGMVQIAIDKVQYNSACYPVARKTDSRKRTLSRACNMDNHCLKWQTVRDPRGLRRGPAPRVCLEYDPS